MSNTKTEMFQSLRDSGATNIERVRELAEGIELYHYNKEGIPTSAIYTCSNSGHFISLASCKRENENDMIQRVIR